MWSWNAFTLNECVRMSSYKAHWNLVLSFGIYGVWTIHYVARAMLTCPSVGHPCPEQILYRLGSIDHAANLLVAGTWARFWKYFDVLLRAINLDLIPLLNVDSLRNIEFVFSTQRSYRPGDCVLHLSWQLASKCFLTSYNMRVSVSQGLDIV